MSKRDKNDGPPTRVAYYVREPAPTAWPLVRTQPIGDQMLSPIGQRRSAAS